MRLSKSDKYRIIALLLLLTARRCFTLAEATAGEGANDSNNHPIIYTSDDDVSWAIRSRNLSSAFGDKQTLYDTFIRECGFASKSATNCVDQEDTRLMMNSQQVMSARNFTETGFLKIRAPREVYKLLLEFWEKNKDKAEVEWTKRISPYHNTWVVDTTIVKTDDSKLEGGGTVLHKKFWQAARDVLEEWSGQRLSPCSAYGIRLYYNQSVLAPHVDRMPLVISAIVNVDQDVDEPWPLEVYDHQGIAHNVTMEPGDMVLYESHSIIHGRPFPLNGGYYANIFVHFEPIGSLHGTTEDIQGESDLPPYIVPGSPWEQIWRYSYPNGWTLFHDPHDAVSKGDIRTLQYMVEKHFDILNEPDQNGWYPVHIAAQYGHIDILQFLIESGIDRSTRVNGNGATALDISYSSLPEGDPCIEYLEQLENKELQEVKELHEAIAEGHIDFVRNLAVNNNQILFQPDGNGWYAIHIAVKFGQLDIVQYFIQNGIMNRNLRVGGNREAPLDIAHHLLPDNHTVVQYLESLEHEWHRFQKAHRTVSKGEMDVVQDIARKDLDSLVRPDEHGWSAIHIAAQFGQLDMLKYLIHIGADPFARIAGNGESPLDIASRIDAGSPMHRYLEDIQRGEEL